MFFNIRESIKSRVRNQRSATRNYRIEWRLDNADADPNTVTVVNATGDGLTYSNPDLARKAIEAWMQLPANYELRDSTDAASGTSLLNSLHGFPSESLVVTEVEGTEGRVYEATATWQASNETATRPSRGQLDNDEEERLTGDTEFGKVKKSLTLSASYPGTTRDFLPLKYLFIRTDLLTEKLDELEIDVTPITPAELKSIMPFPPGSVNARPREKDSEQSDIGGVTINSPPINYTLTYEFVETDVQSDYVSRLADAAHKGVRNSDSFTVGGTLYRPGELLLSSFDANYNDSNTSLTVGLSVGGIVDCSTTQQNDPSPPDWYDGPLPIVLDFEDLVMDGTGKYTLIYKDNSAVGDAARYDFNSAAIFDFTLFDYIWTYTASRTDSGNVQSDVDYVSIHQVWKAVSFSDLFGADSV